MPKAVIFDVDGTLVDSVDLHAKAWQAAFRNFGHDIDFAVIRGQIGKGGDQLMPVFLSGSELAKQGTDLEKRRGEVLRQTYLSQVTAFPKVLELFERLKADGTRIALASSAKEDELARYKEVLQIDGLVDVEASSDDVEKSKPLPDILQVALKRLGVPATQAMVVGDTPYDAKAAAKAGLSTIGLLCGGFSEASLKKAGCIAIYKDPADLLQHYDHSPIAHDAVAD